ncbi:MAG: hypothetical protein H0U70_09045 [Tatlockia sp.]|nr:hypothetical protein [Tatlockia sp.]
MSRIQFQQSDSLKRWLDERYKEQNVTFTGSPGTKSNEQPSNIPESNSNPPVKLSESRYKFQVVNRNADEIDEAEVADADHSTACMQ